MNDSTRELATPAGLPPSGNPPHAAAGSVQVPANPFPQDKRALPDMTPEQWERWEREMCGPW